MDNFFLVKYAFRADYDRLTLLFCLFDTESVADADGRREYARMREANDAAVTTIAIRRFRGGRVTREACAGGGGGPSVESFGRYALHVTTAALIGGKNKCASMTWQGQMHRPLYCRGNFSAPNFWARIDFETRRLSARRQLINDLIMKEKINSSARASITIFYFRYEMYIIQSVLKFVNFIAGPASIIEIHEWAQNYRIRNLYFIPFTFDYTLYFIISVCLSLSIRQKHKSLLVCILQNRTGSRVSPISRERGENPLRNTARVSSHVYVMENYVRADGHTQKKRKMSRSCVWRDTHVSRTRAHAR